MVFMAIREEERFPAQNRKPAWVIIERVVSLKDVFTLEKRIRSAVLAWQKDGYIEFIPNEIETCGHHILTKVGAALCKQGEAIYSLNKQGGFYIQPDGPRDKRNLCLDIGWTHANTQITDLRVSLREMEQRLRVVENEISLLNNEKDRIRSEIPQAEKRLRQLENQRTWIEQESDPLLEDAQAARA